MDCNSSPLNLFLAYQYYLFYSEDYSKEFKIIKLIRN